jgi:flagellin-like protein
MFNKSLNKKGLSAVVTVLLLIALTVAVVAIVWGVVNNLVTDELEGAGSCFGVLDKVSLDSRYTCYNGTGNELWFSISMGNIDVDEVLVSITGEGTSSGFKINNTDSQITNVFSFPSRGTSVKLPGKNSGLTYIFDLGASGFTGEPDKIEIAPIISGNQCGISDTIQQFDSCSSIT